MRTPPQTLPFLIGIALTIGCSLFTVGCADDSKEAPTDAPSATPAGVFVDTEVSDGQLGEFHVVLQVKIADNDVGSMTIKLRPELAPKTVRNFLRLCSRGFYDGLTFHRVVRSFMVQGGCEQGNGTGSGPLPPIPGEFSDSVEARHVYGTVSMARGPNPNSAGAQFFIICDEGPAAWSLDGQYACFGQVVEGQNTLEAIASVPVVANFLGEDSKPTQSIEIVSARVVRGGLPDAVPIQLPEREQDRVGWPNTVEVQSLLVAVGGGLIPVERSPEEAEALAQRLLERAQAGEDFEALVREYSDDAVQKGMETPVGYRFANTHCNPKQGQREVFDLNVEYREKLDRLGVSKQTGRLSPEQVALKVREFQLEIQRQIRLAAYIPREQRPALADPAFDMEVGEFRLVPRDPSRSLEGVHVLYRIR